MTIERQAEIEQAGLLLRYAAAVLNQTERLALSAFALDVTQVEAAQWRGMTKGGIYMAQKSGLRKMRMRLHQLGIRSSADVLSGGVG